MRALIPQMKWAVLVPFVVAGCASTPPAPSQTVEDPAARTSEAVLGQRDVVEIRVFREPELGGVYRVSAEGTIEFPLIGAVQLAGQSPSQVSADIRSRLNGGYLKDAQVTVFVREHNSQKVYVLGQVNKPGTFSFEHGMSVIQAIGTAGGFTKLASSSVSVTRVVDKKEKRFEVPVGKIRAGEAPNFGLKPGDIVYVPEAIF